MRKILKKAAILLTLGLFTALSSPLSASAEIMMAKAEGNPDASYLAEVNRLLGFLPEDMTYEFALSGWTIWVTDRDIDSTYCNGKWGSVMGVLLYDENRIVIEDRESAVQESTLHEMGHWFDYTHGSPSETAEFADIYANETSAFLSAFNYTSYYAPEEMFAEATWKYWCDGKTLRLACPRLYEFMDEVYRAQYPSAYVTKEPVVEETPRCSEDSCGCSCGCERCGTPSVPEEIEETESVEEIVEHILDPEYDVEVPDSVRERIGVLTGMRDVQ